MEQETFNSDRHNWAGNKGEELKADEFNSIGIDGKCDLKRIRKLMIIGLFSACMVFVGDWILGYGVKDAGLTGLPGKLSIYTGKSDAAYIVSSLLGVIGIVLEGLSYFSIYRLMAEKSPKHAHNLRTGIIGYIAFGACGVHMPCLLVAWLYNYLCKKAPDIALDCSYKAALYFMLPSCILFAIFFVVMTVTQISAFAKGLTPYPKWCWIFNVAFGMLLTAVITIPLGKFSFGNALSAAWISIGNIWQFGGLLIMMRKIKLKA